MRVGIIESGVNVYSFSSARQLIELPAGRDEYVLSFWWYPSSRTTREGDTNPVSEFLPGAVLYGPDAGDYQLVLLLDSNDQEIARLLNEDSRNDRQWLYQSYDISAYAGQAVKLYFLVINNGSGGTAGMFIDNVKVEICE